MKKIPIFFILLLFLTLHGFPVVHAQWNETGVVVSNAEGIQRQCVMAPDDSGGVILVWVDHRYDYENTDIYAMIYGIYGK